jgi:C-terminal processing protease CtpA/Prc
VNRLNKPAFSFSSGLQNTPDTQNSKSSAIYQSGLIQMNYSDYTIFDCVVPAGPLGIVVDSTPMGPIIHSIKSSSHFIHTLRPGDLIVGLDGINTRGLSAPSLTRLMAKKIQQPERILSIMRHK